MIKLKEYEKPSVVISVFEESDVVCASWEKHELEENETELFW